jgi:hypothetical protein
MTGHRFWAVEQELQPARSSVKAWGGKAAPSSVAPWVVLRVQRLPAMAATKTMRSLAVPSVVLQVPPWVSPWAASPAPLWVQGWVEQPAPALRATSVAARAPNAAWMAVDGRVTAITPAIAGATSDTDGSLNPATTGMGTVATHGATTGLKTEFSLSRSD